MLERRLTSLGGTETWRRCGMLKMMARMMRAKLTKFWPIVPVKHVSNFFENNSLLQKHRQTHEKLPTACCHCEKVFDNNIKL